MGATAVGRNSDWMVGTQLRFEFLSNSCQFLVGLALAAGAEPAVAALLLCWRCEGSTKKTVVGSGLRYDPSCSFDNAASPLQDSGRQSFHARRKSFRPMAEDAVGAMAAR